MVIFYKIKEPCKFCKTSVWLFRFRQCSLKYLNLEQILQYLVYPQNSQQSSIIAQMLGMKFFCMWNVQLANHVQNTISHIKLAIKIKLTKHTLCIKSVQVINKWLHDVLITGFSVPNQSPANILYFFDFLKR